MRATPLLTRVKLRACSDQPAACAAQFPCPLPSQAAKSQRLGTTDLAYHLTSFTKGYSNILLTCIQYLTFPSGLKTIFTFTYFYQLYSIVQAEYFLPYPNFNGLLKIL